MARLFANKKRIFNSKNKIREMKRPENILSQPWKIQEYVNWLESQLAEAKGENAKLKEALGNKIQRLVGSNRSTSLHNRINVALEALTQEKGNSDELS